MPRHTIIGPQVPKFDPDELARRSEPSAIARVLHLLVQALQEENSQHPKLDHTLRPLIRNHLSQLQIDLTKQPNDPQYEFEYRVLRDLDALLK